MKSTSRILGLACSLVLAATGSMNALAQSAQAKTQYDQKWLSATADELNKSLPKQVDPDTRWDRVIPGPGMKLTYSYTLTSKETGQVDIERFINNMHATLRRAVCSREATLELMKNGVVLSYLYRGRDGGFISMLEVKPYCD